MGESLAPTSPPSLLSTPWRGGGAAGGKVRLLLCSIGFAILALVAGVFITRKLAEPAAVPDHASTFTASAPMLFADRVTLAQRIKPRRDRFTAVDLLLAAESEALPGNVVLEIRAWPSLDLLRTARVPANSLPTERIWDMRPGQPREQWTTFGFDPIADAAEREFLFTLSYTDGADRPGSRLATLARFSASLPKQIYVNGFAQDGTLLYRLAGAGTRAQALGVAAENLARVQPVLAGTLYAPLALAACCLVLAGTIIRTALMFR